MVADEPRALEHPKADNSDQDDEGAVTLMTINISPREEVCSVFSSLFPVPNEILAHLNASSFSTKKTFEVIA